MAGRSMYNSSIKPKPTMNNDLLKAPKLKLSLSQKALLLVMVPLVFDLVLLAGLFVQLNHAERLAQQAEHERLIASQVDSIFRDVSQAAAATSSTTKGVVTHYSSLPLLVKNDVKMLKEFTFEYPNEFSAALRVEKISASIMDILDEDKARFENDGVEFPLGYLNSRQQLRAMLSYLKSTSESIYPPEQKDELRKRVLASGKNLKVAIVAGSVVNLILALLLTIYFNRGTTSRLIVLMKNTIALSRGQELTPEVGGSDEIAQLDRTFHDMASSLKAAERAKAELTAMITHDLRSPLTTVQMFLEMTQNEFYGPCPPELLQYAGRAKILVDRLSALTDDILCFEKMEAGEFNLTKEENDLSEIIDESVHTVSGAASRNNVNIRTSSNKLQISTDRRRLTQVLTNLLFNAIKVSPQGAEVLVENRETERDVLIEVSDKGPGVADAEKELIFEKFKQGVSKPTEVGTGLGLAISKMIIEKHGGKIGVKDGTDGGAVFWFTLPKQKDFTAQAQPALPHSELQT